MADRSPVGIADALIAALIVFSVLWGLFRVSSPVALAGSSASLLLVLFLERSHARQRL